MVNERLPARYRGMADAYRAGAFPKGDFRAVPAGLQTAPPPTGGDGRGRSAVAQRGPLTLSESASLLQAGAGCPSLRVPVSAGHSPEPRPNTWIHVAAWQCS